MNLTWKSGAREMDHISHMCCSRSGYVPTPFPASANSNRLTVTKADYSRFSNTSLGYRIVFYGRCTNLLGVPRDERFKA
ncbi:hypothetical protein J6590_045094 [Homalodisca vitripennis]|nr:hypothetical protein J6590_045094 [Homalodisca vitripennis]